MAPDTPHQELPSETLSRYVAVMIDTRFLQAQLAVYGTSPGDIRNAMVCPSNQRLIDELKGFMTEYEEAVPGFDAMMKASALKITHLVIRQFLEVKRPDCVIVHRMAINKALDFLNEKYGEKISIHDLASSAGCSVSHFSRLFKHETGIAPSDYVMKVRLDCAKRMLRTDEDSVTQIGLACGFNSSAYFSHCFSRAFGVSPSDYRKALELS
jgi:AraC-like DNA-binding protein